MVESKRASPSTVKKLQIRNLLIAVVTVIVLIAGLYTLLERDSGSVHKAPVKEVRFTSPMDNDALNSAWLEQFQSKVTNQEKETGSLKEQIATLAKENKSEEQQKNYQSLVTKLTLVENELAQLKSHPPMAGGASSPSNISGAHFPVIPGEMNADLGAENAVDLSAVANDGDDYLHLSAKPTETYSVPSKNPTNYVPTGTQVLGVLLMGADLVAADYDQENPKPILIRLIENGTLPNHQESHLKGCLITGAITGDISSSRGNVRIERLSCVKPDSGIVDVQVEGVVATNAKEGITGQLYTREGSRVAGATFAGTLAGVANGVSEGYVDTQNSLFGASGTISGGNLAKYGALQGASSGLNKLGDFEMNRAEQIHPVIEVNGGKLVTVVFTKQGFFIDGKEHSQNESYDSVSTTNELISSPLSDSAQSSQRANSFFDKK